MKTKRILSAVIAVFMLLALVPCNGIAAMNAEKDTEGTVHYYGDATQDDELNTGDATQILRHCAELITFGDELFELTSEGVMKIDANKDGNLNTADATYVLRCCADLATANEYYDTIPTPIENYVVGYECGQLPAELPEGVTIVVPETIRYIVGTEVTVAEAPVFVGANASDEVVETPEGFNFLGWYSFVDAKDYQPGETFTMPAEHVAFVAHWEGVEIPVPEVKYLVTFALGELPVELPGNIGMEVPASFNAAEGEEVIVCGAPFCLDGDILVDMPENLKFLGWNSSVDNVLYQPKDRFIMPAEDVTFTAEWEKVDEPTPTPDQQAEITLTYYDKFNEMNLPGQGKMTLDEGMHTINATNIVLPENYVLANNNFTAQVTVVNGVATPSSIRVEVYPQVAVENIIYTVIYNLNGFNKINDNLAGNYMLGADIELGNANRMPFGWSWTNPAEDDTSFTGHFNGNGYLIANLKIDYCMDEESLYSNVGLFAVNEGTIENVLILGQVYGDYNVGMVAGRNDGTIRDCYTYGNVGALDLEDSTRGGCGGITGSNSGTVTRCCFEGYAEGYYWIGGLIGKNFGTLTESYFAGGINTGLYNDGYINQFAQYEVYIRYIGGLCGGMQDGTIKNCYVYMTGSFDAYMAVGGMIGWSKGGTLVNVFVANLSKNIYAVDSNSAATDIGYMISAPTYSGLGVTANDVLTSNGQLPSEFPTEIWDMNGACHRGLPDLVNNRRPNDGFFSEG